MQFSLLDLLLLLLFGGVAVYFMNSIRVRELALQAARRACTKQGAQLLDATVSSEKVSLSRDHNGQWRVWRQYRFEYTYDGELRKGGNIIMLGNRLQALVMAEAPDTLH